MKCEQVGCASGYKKGDVVLHPDNINREKFSLICENVDVFIKDGEIIIMQDVPGFFRDIDKIYRKAK